MDKSTRRLPPGPKGHFLLGNLPEFGKDLLGFITQCARESGAIDVLRVQQQRQQVIAPRPSGLRRRSALADHAVDEVVQAVDRGPVPQVARRRDAVGDGERPAESYRDFLDYDLERMLDLLDPGSDVDA